MQNVVTNFRAPLWWIVMNANMFSIGPAVLETII